MTDARPESAFDLCLKKDLLERRLQLRYRALASHGEPRQNPAASLGHARAHGPGIWLSSLQVHAHGSNGVAGNGKAQARSRSKRWPKVSCWTPEVRAAIFQAAFP